MENRPGTDLNLRMQDTENHTNVIFDKTSQNSKYIYCPVLSINIQVI